MRKLIGKILTRSDTSANWSKNNPVLGKGECGYATDLRRTKHGDGTTKWNNLKWDDAATTNGHTVNSDVPAGAKFTDTTYAAATTSANGLMSAADKAKLDGIDPSAITTNAANIKKNADAISAETTRAKAAEKANADTISAEVTRAKKAEEANTQLTNDLKTGLTSGTVKVAKATSADSSTALGSVTAKFFAIPDNGARKKYLLFYDITEWASKTKDAGTYAYDGYFFSRRSVGFVGNNYTGTLSMVASYCGMSGGKTIKSDDSSTLRLRTTSSMYKPVILHNTNTDKYYLALETYGNGRDLVLFGIFQGTFIGTWIENTGAAFSDGTLPDGYELYSEGYVSIPYERTIADKNGKDITEYLVDAAYADGAFTFTRGNGGKTVLTIPDAVSNTVNSHIANKSNPHEVTKAQVGLGSVANLDQSKAIKSITRSGTTFTATALDGTTSTFTQQDTNTTYGVATSSADGLMSAADKKAVDREFFRMLPKGGTYIPANADLNSIEYLKVGNYYNPLIAETLTMKNCPAGAFIMYVLSPLNAIYDIESTNAWVYRLRIFVEYTGNIFTQLVSSDTTPGSFNYGPWVKMTNSNDLAAVSNTINTHIANKSNPHAVTKAQVGLGSVANLDQSKAIKSITRSGTTFTATALDGTTSTFTQQDTNTTYPVATTSADGLMSKTDKAKLDGVAAGADVSPIKTVKVNGTALTPDSSKAVNVTVPTLANNATTTTSGMALDARMGKTLSDQISSVKTGAIDQIVNLTVEGWTGDAAPYSQAVNVTGMSSELLCELFSACSKSATVAERKAYNKAYAIVVSGYAETADGKVTFSVDKKPAIDIGVRIKSISKANAVSDQTSSDISNAVDAMGNTLEGRVNALSTDLAKLYPVGSIYLSTNSTNPATFIGGTWEQLKDVFLLAAGDTYTAGSTGGEATHTLSVDEMPSHRHSSDSYLNGYANSGIVEQDRYCTWINNGTINNNVPYTAESGPIRTSWVGGSQPHNNMPPYLAIYMWQRVS